MVSFSLLCGKESLFVTPSMPEIANRCKMGNKKHTIMTSTTRWLELLVKKARKPDESDGK